MGKLVLIKFREGGKEGKEGNKRPCKIIAQKVENMFQAVVQITLHAFEDTPIRMS